MNRALMLVLLAVLAIAAPFYVYPILLMTVLSYVVFASSFNLLLGYAGLLCFGHAMFFGTAAYFAGWLLKNTALSIELCFLLSALSMGGLPPFLGFLAKEEMYAGLTGPSWWPTAILLVAMTGNALMFVIGFAVALKPFLGEKVETPKHAHEGPALLWLGPATLSLVALGAALFSETSHHFISSPMASAVAGEEVHVHISVVPHPGTAFYLSLATIAAGIVLYTMLGRIRAAMAGVLAAIGWGPDKGFDQFMRGLVRASSAVTRILQPGQMDIYMTAIMVLIGLALIVPMVVFGELPVLPEFPKLFSYEWTVIFIALVGLVAVIWAANRLTAIVSLGIQGFAVALLFMLMGAPDLSFTQFMVETLSVVILALVMTRLRLGPADHRPTAEKVVDMTIALVTGAGFGLILLKVTQLRFDYALTDFFNANSVAVAHGHNIVNVILVDFRGIDTFGEIAVVMITGLAILALIRIRAVRAPVDNQPDEVA